MSFIPTAASQASLICRNQRTEPEADERCNRRKIARRHRREEGRKRPGHGERWAKNMDASEIMMKNDGGYEPRVSRIGGRTERHHYRYVLFFHLASRETHSTRADRTLRGAQMRISRTQSRCAEGAAPAKCNQVRPHVPRTMLRADEEHRVKAGPRHTKRPSAGQRPPDTCAKGRVAARTPSRHPRAGRRFSIAFRPPLRNPRGGSVSEPGRGPRTEARQAMAGNVARHRRR